jgi:hypothetical protein
MRAEFGATWADLVRDWCLGVEPQEPPFTAWLALEALDRLWPEYVDRMVASPTRGLGVVTYAIHLGSILRVCEALVGFGPVMKRLRLGEDGALAELFVASHLVRIGYVSELEAALGNNRVDASVRVDQTTVYVEVISPERSQTMIEGQVAIQALAARVREENTGKKIELLLSVDLTDAVVAAVCDFLPRAPLSADIQEMAGLGFAIVEPADGTLVVSPRIRSAGDTTVFGAASGFSGDGSLSSVRMPITDHRVQRLLDGELHHFTRDTVNVLAIDVSHAAGSIRGWTPLIERRFQPALNRRLGAVVVYQLSETHPAIKYRWRALRNPHAYQPVPDALLVAIESLNN